MELPADGIQGQVTTAVSTTQMFNNYVHARTATNWKFWIFGLFIRPLFESYDSAIVTTNRDEFCQSLLTWLKDHCNLLTLRKAIHGAVFYVGRQTSVISSPENLPKEALEAAFKDFSATSDGMTTTPATAPTLATAPIKDNGLYRCAYFR